MKRVALVLSIAACASHEAPQATVVELPTASASPVATLSIALPQKFDAPPHRSAHAWMPPTPRQPPDVIQARECFKRGVQQYDAGNYAQSVIEFETAYSYSPHEAVLYNIAAAHEHSGRKPEALDVYGRFADTHPPNEAQVREKIEALRK
jgi:hypothetical protein